MVDIATSNTGNSDFIHIRLNSDYHFVKVDNVEYCIKGVVIDPNTGDATYYGKNYTII